MKGANSHISTLDKYIMHLFSCCKFKQVERLTVFTRKNMQIDLCSTPTIIPQFNKNLKVRRTCRSQSFHRMLKNVENYSVKSASKPLLIFNFASLGSFFFSSFENTDFILAPNSEQQKITCVH